jgi:hypothetical protein
MPDQMRRHYLDCIPDLQPPADSDQIHRSPDKTALGIMRHTTELCYAIGKKGFVAAEVIDHEMTFPVGKEHLGMAPGAARLVIKHHDRRSGLKHRAAIGPQIRPMRLALARIQLRHRCFIGMQHQVFEQ